MDGLSADEISRAARALADAIRRGMCLEKWPDGIGPTSLDEAYLVQGLVHDLLRRHQIGWKVGWTTRALQEANGATEPMAGRVLEPTTVRSRSNLCTAKAGNLKCEAELAFRLAKDLPPRDDPYSTQDVLDAVDVVRPSVEIVGTHFVDLQTVGRVSVVADNGAHIGLVLGDPIANWRALDRVNLVAELYVNGAKRAVGMGSNVLGDPLTPCVWLANWLSRRGSGLKAGDVVSSGSFLGALPIPDAAEVLADFGDCGRVHVTLSS